MAEQQQAAIGDDRLVAVAQVLARAVLDPALALDRPLVVDVDVEAHAGIGLGLLLGERCSRSCSGGRCAACSRAARRAAAAARASAA